MINFNKTSYIKIILIYLILIVASSFFILPMLAAFVTAYMSTFSFPESIEFANTCASISVKKFGNYVVSLDDLK